MMVAADDPFIGIHRARNARNHIVELLLVPIEFQLQMHFGGAWPDAVRNRQPTAPLYRRHPPLQRRQQRLRIRIRNWHHRYLGQRHRLVERQPLGFRRRAHARRQRIARIYRHVHHAAALHAVFGAIRPGRKSLSRRVAVVAWIGVDQAPDGAVLGRHLGLDAAPTASVARDHNRAFYRHALPVQRFVILRHAVVDVHQRPGHVAIDRVRVVSRELFIMLPGSRIHSHGRLLDLGHEVLRRDHFQQPLLRRGKEHVEVLDVRIEAPLAEFGEQPLGVVAVVSRPHMVRARREALHVSAHQRRIRNRAELGFPIALHARRIRRESRQRHRLLRNRHRRRKTQTKQCSQTCFHKTAIV